MISQLKGVFTDKLQDYVVVDVNGVGYQVSVSKTSLDQLPSINEGVTLYIHTHVREDQISLFGFATKEEKTIFQRLLNVSGIGPKMAMTILSGMRPADIVEAVVKENLAGLSAIQGIGKKTAERIIVDLKDKFLKEFGGVGAQPIANKPLYNDALSALVNLGYQRAMVEKIFTKIGLDSHSTVQAVVKHALKELRSA